MRACLFIVAVLSYGQMFPFPGPGTAAVGSPSPSYVGSTFTNTGSYDADCTVTRSMAAGTWFVAVMTQLYQATEVDLMQLSTTNITSPTIIVANASYNSMAFVKGQATSTGNVSYTWTPDTSGYSLCGIIELADVSGGTSATPACLGSFTTSQTTGAITPSGTAIYLGFAVNPGQALTKTSPSGTTDISTGMVDTGPYQILYAVGTGAKTFTWTIPMADGLQIGAVAIDQ